MIGGYRSRLATAVVALIVGVAVGAGAHDDDGKRRRGDAPAPRTESLDRPRHLAVVRYKPHVVLGWSYDGAMTTGFEVERSIVDGSPDARPDQFKRIGVAGRDARSFRDPTSRPGMTYIYRIRAAGPGTVSPYSTEVIVKINTASGRRR
ncbi:MAG: fibronectin type III domain-containing protein [Candidatus Rokubacteria bacterium]|nr:fibronectin type III domain-containing protein [Candidatus Rokubacteria bacterium]